MAQICKKCGSQLEEGAQFCKACGTPVETAGGAGPGAAGPAAGPAAGAAQKGTFGFKPTYEVYDAADIEKNKTMAGLAYILFFLPLIACPDSHYAKFHANQGLLLTILIVAGSIILGVIPIIGWIIMPFFYIITTIWVIIGLINGLNGKAHEVPLIGKFRIIK